MAECPPWCTQDHTRDVVAWTHCHNVAALGPVLVAATRIRRSDGDEVMVHAPGVTGAAWLSAEQARVLDDLLAALPPEELPGLVAGLRAGADLVDPPAPEGGETP